MAYNNGNQQRFEAYVMDVYGRVKEYDVPDTHIVRHVFPKHGIFISYRRFMEIKHPAPVPAMAQSQAQLAMF